MALPPRPAPPVTPVPAARPVVVAPARDEPVSAWGLVLLAGGLLVIAAQAIHVGDAMDDLEGKEQASFLLRLFGTWVISLGLLAAGALGRAPWGVRAAFLIAGAFVLTQGAGLASLFFGGLFGDF